MCKGGINAQANLQLAGAERRRECDQRFAEQMERHARGYDVKVTLGGGADFLAYQKP